MAKKFNAFAAFSWLICGWGWIWGIITFFSLAGEINKATKKDTCQGWAILIPIYSGLHMSVINAELNALIKEKGADTPPLSDNIIINILLLFIPFYSAINAWNKIAEKL